MSTPVETVEETSAALALVAAGGSDEDARQTEVADSAAAILGEVTDMLGPIFEQMEWAEDEIVEAQLRHPKQANLLYHSFLLLRGTHERMSQPFVYRSHCRELLERVAAEQSTKEGTAAEVVCALMDVSLRVPLNTNAFGLYLRMWKQAGFPPLGDPVEGKDEHYEAIAASEIDDMEAWTRRKLAVSDRVLKDVECHGMHHGDKVACEYATTLKAAA